LLQLVDFRALAADDDARPAGIDVDLQPVRGARRLELADAGVREALLERPLQRDVLVQQLRVVLVGVPQRLPRLVEAEAESERVNFLTHVYSFAFFARALRAGFSVDPAAAADATGAIFSGRSDTRTVRCAVRFSTRY